VASKVMRHSRQLRLHTTRRTFPSGGLAPADG